VTALALSIGVSTAVFAVVSAVLLRPLPYADPNSLVQVHETYPPADSLGLVSVPNLKDWRDRAPEIQDWAFYTEQPRNLDEGGIPERLVCVEVSANLFALGSVPWRRDRS
jgi:hypothetical protein